MRLRHLVLLPCLLAAPVQAQDAPACGPAQEGVTACLAGKLCACRFIRGGSLTGQRDRHAWDCGILRPACGPGLVPPSAASPLPDLPMPNLLLRLPDRR